MNNILLKGIDFYKNPRDKKTRLSVLSFILVVVGVIWFIVYFTGGTKYAYLHLNYFPIVFSALFFGGKGGAGIAIIAGILMGPLMPLDVENNIPQSVEGYLIRTVIFIAVGIFAGFMSSLLRQYLTNLQNTLMDVAFVYAKTLKNYASMVSARDEQTANHCERVAYNSLLLGQAIGLDAENSEDLYWSGLLHDLGKIGIKEKILLKPGKLTENEYTEIKNHTKIGYDLIISLSENFKSIAEGVRTHHERWDGSGYPDGLKGETIPLSGRILAIVDVFEALTSDRPYKNAWSPEDALQYLVDHKGIHFDPKLVENFEKLYQDGKIWVSNQPVKLEKSLLPEVFKKERLKLRT